ncbi:MAG TPA: hypothetical protein VGQ06_16180 [Gemmatimonadales bacterium]|jgi:hypothetical protein|nr:hypothetical protein [Gemmatimonadales bacterium]
MAATVAVLLALLALLAWFFWPSAGARPAGRRAPRDGIDQAELEAAEREVQEAQDADSVRDWGPGASQPPRE